MSKKLEKPPVPPKPQWLVGLPVVLNTCTTPPDDSQLHDESSDSISELGLDWQKLSNSTDSSPQPERDGQMVVFLRRRQPRPQPLCLHGKTRSLDSQPSLSAGTERAQNLEPGKSHGLVRRSISTDSGLSLCAPNPPYSPIFQLRVSYLLTGSILFVCSFCTKLLEPKKKAQHKPTTVLCSLYLIAIMKVLFFSL